MQAWSMLHSRPSNPWLAARSKAASRESSQPQSDWNSCTDSVVVGKQLGLYAEVNRFSEQHQLGFGISAFLCLAIAQLQR